MTGFNSRLPESYGHPMTFCDLEGVSRPSANSAATKPIIDAFSTKMGVLWILVAATASLRAECAILVTIFGTVTRSAPAFLHRDLKPLFPGRVATNSPHLSKFLSTNLTPPRRWIPLFKVTDSIFFTTELLPEPAPPVDSWW